MTAIVLPPSHNATRSITSVPHDDIHANTPASHGSHHAQANAINPAIVANPTEGDMRMMLLLWDATLGNRSLKIVEIPIKTTLNNPDFPEK